MGVNPKVYPITAAVEKDLVPPGKELCKEAQALVDNLLEYEHGTADAEDVFDPVLEECGVRKVIEKVLESSPDPELDYRDLCLKLYAAVVVDLALVLQTLSEEES